MNSLPTENTVQQHNFRVGVLNGWVVALGDGFFNVSVVVAGFAAHLGASNAVIGLLPSITQGCYMLPQLWVASRVRAMPYKLPIYRSAAGVRTATYALMVAVAATLWQSPALCLGLFVLLLTINSLASGLSGLPWLEVASKVIAPERRAAFFGTRNLWGGLLAFAAGLVVRLILGSELAFPYNYALIFGVATLFYTVGYGLWGRVSEPPDEVQPASNLRQELSAIGPLLRADRYFRAFLWLRLTLAFASLADPFYAVYALRELQLSPSMLGVFLMAITGVAPLSNLFWRRVAERKGSRRILRFACAAALVAPVLALVLGQAARGLGKGLLGWLYLGCFVAYSVAAQGFNLGNTNHLLNISPAHSRSRYIGTLNTLVGVALFAPALGGMIADKVSYEAVFICAAGLYLLAWFLCGYLRRDA